MSSSDQTVGSADTHVAEDLGSSDTCVAEPADLGSSDTCVAEPTDLGSTDTCVAEPPDLGSTDTLPVDSDDLGSTESVMGRDVRVARRGRVVGDTDFHRGDLIDRYLIIGLLGRGGMGVVLSAYDPDLDRKVAIKLVRADHSASRRARESRDRLVREAQAMARLAHPNVVGVYDVGTIDDEVFIVMEFVAGGTVRDWLSSGKRTWRQIVDVYLQAGRGLAAAHALDLVHRDFKPSNVLIGEDGRVRVADFGLVSAPSSSREPTDTPSPRLDSSSSITQHGAIMGTPAYMAPEQRVGASADARADQYALCVALYEALYGQRPFRPEAPDTIVRPEQTTVPARLFDIVSRGMSADPAERFDRLEELLELLERDPETRDRQRLNANALYRLGQAHTGNHEEEAAEAALREAVHCARLAKDAGLEAKVWTSLVYLYGVRSGQLDAALEAVEHARAALAAEGGNPATEGHLANNLGLSLKRAERYADARDQLTKSVSMTERCWGPEHAEMITPLNSLAAVLSDMAIWDEARGLYERAIEIARAGLGAHDEPLATALNGLGLCLCELGDTTAGLVQLENALTVRSSTYGHEHIETGAIHVNVGYAMEQLGRFREARDHYERGLAITERVRGPDDEDVAACLGNLGRVLGELGERELECLERALAIVEAARGPDSTDVAAQLDNMGVALFERACAEDALRHFRRALEIRRAVLGEGHPDVAKSHNNVGGALWHLNDLDNARTHFDAALQGWEAVLGPDHPDVATALSNLGAVLELIGELQPAREHHERAISILERALGPEHVELAATLCNLGDVLFKLGDYAAAQANYQRSIDVREAALGPEHRKLGIALMGIANCQRSNGDDAAALPVLERALAIREADELAPFDLAYTRVVLADVLWNLDHERSRALALAEDARATYASVDPPPPILEQLTAWLEARRPS